jgi:hypothetical protein
MVGFALADFGLNTADVWLLALAVAGSHSVPTLISIGSNGCPKTLLLLLGCEKSIGYAAVELGLIAADVLLLALAFAGSHIVPTLMSIGSNGGVKELFFGLWNSFLACALCSLSAGRRLETLLEAMLPAILNGD